MTVYEGPVCYADGWHMTVDENGQPGERLFLEDDGTYRTAEEGDESWHDRKHGQFVSIELEDGQAGATVTAEEFEAIQELLAQRRGGDQ